MAKTNFTKVEGMLDEGLRKMTVEHLLHQTEASSDPDKTSNQAAVKQVEERLKLITTLQRDLKFLDNVEQEPYDLFGITKKQVNKYLKHPDSLTSEEWEELKETQDKVLKFRKDFEKSLTKEKNEELIEQQIRRHKTKRFNINDKWLPLQ